MRTQDVWAVLSAQPFPFLHELAPLDRDRFVLLDTSLHDCLEEWCASGGQLSSRSVVLLDGCARSITKRFRLLNGEWQWYGWRNSEDWPGWSCAASIWSRHRRG